MSAEETARLFDGELAEPGVRCGVCARRARWLYPLLLPKGTFDYPDHPPAATILRVCNHCYREVVHLLRGWLRPRRRRR